MGKTSRETIKAHNVFLSWSGDRSLYVAKFVHDWLPKVLQRAKPWLSEVDIDKGTMGLDQIKKALAGMKVGIFFLTPENRDSLWVPYEAGALANELDDKSRICTYLLAGLQIRHVNGPLGNFQHTKSDKDDTKKLVHTINRAIGEEVIPDSTVDATFEKWWPDLQSHLDLIPKTEEMPKPLPKPEDMIAEILELSRAAANSRKQSEWIDQFSADFKEFMPGFMQIFKTVSPSQLLPTPPAPPPPRGPTATFCIKLVGDPDIKKVEGTMAVLTSMSQVAVLIGNEVVAKFESVENWWKEIQESDLPDSPAESSEI